MPHIKITLYNGKSLEEKMRIGNEIAMSIEKATTWTEGDISISFEEVEPTVFVEKVKENISNDLLVKTSKYIV